MNLALSYSFTAPRGPLAKSKSEYKLIEMDVTSERESEQQGQATQQVGYGAYARTGRHVGLINKTDDVLRLDTSSNTTRSHYDLDLEISDNDEDPEGGTQGQQAVPETSFPVRTLA